MLLSVVLTMDPLEFGRFVRRFDSSRGLWMGADGQTAVDHQVGAGDEGRRRIGQKENRAGHIVRHATAAQGMQGSGLLRQSSRIFCSLQIVFPKLGIDVPGADCVDADVTAGQFQRKVARECQQAGLGTSVGNGIGKSAEGVNGRDVDDGAARRRETGKQSLGQQQGGAQVDRHNSFPKLGCYLFEGLIVLDAGIVDQHIDASELFLNFPGNPQNGCLVSQIGFEQGGVSQARSLLYRDRPTHTVAHRRQGSAVQSPIRCRVPLR